MEDRLLLRPMEAALMLAVGRTRIYEMIAEGSIPSVRIGQRSIRVPIAALREWLESQESGNELLATAGKPQD